MPGQQSGMVLKEDEAFGTKNLQGDVGSSGKGIEDDQISGVRAPVTLVLLLGVFFAVMQSMNFGLMTGMVNLAAPSVEVALNLGKWGTNCNEPWTTILPDGSEVEQDTTDAELCQTGTESDKWSWIVSVFALGGMVGAFAGGACVKRWGTKWTIIVNNVFFVAAGVMQAFSKEKYGLMVVARIVAGVGVGTTCSSVPVWVSECSPDHVRGMLGVIHQLFITLGIFIATVLGMEKVFGNADRWQLLYGSIIVPSVISAIGFFFMPETPSFLLGRGDIDGLRRSLTRLRGANYNVDDEIEEMCARQRNNDEENAMPTMDAIKLMFTRPYMKQTTIAVGIQVCQQMSGINAIMFYSSSIFVDAGFDNVETATLLVNGMNFLSTVAGVPLVERLGRRGLLLGGFAGMTLMHALFGIGMLQDWEVPTIVFMLLGVIFFAVGPGPIPWLITAEIFPSSLRFGAVAISVFTNWLMTFAVGKFFPPLQEKLTDSTFFFFCGWSFAITLFVYFLVPETKGKSIQEILRGFGHIVPQSSQDVIGSGR